MKREIDSSQDREINRFGWRLLKNKDLNKSYVLGRSKLVRIPRDYRRSIKLGIQKSTPGNIRIRNINLSGNMRVIYRLYQNDTVFQSVEVLFFL